MDDDKAAIRQHWCHYASPEPVDTRPVSDPRWAGFVRWIEVTPEIRKDLATRDGFARSGAELWAAYRAGATSKKGR